MGNNRDMKQLFSYVAGCTVLLFLLCNLVQSDMRRAALKEHGFKVEFVTNPISCKIQLTRFYYRQAGGISSSPTS